MVASIAGARLHYERYPERVVTARQDRHFDFPAIHNENGSINKIARTAGRLYLIVVLTGAFSLACVPSLSSGAGCLQVFTTK